MLETGLKEYLLNSPSKDKWLRIGILKRSGILVPLFSVYSKNSIGIGDFSDLKLLIDWASITGNSIIHLLPLNEVGAMFCPYDSISSFALEPMYISFKDLAESGNKIIRAKINELKKNFPPGMPYVDYAIKREKINLLWEIYTRIKDYDSGEFKKFKDEFTYWLLDFAIYKVLKAHHKGCAWWFWEDRFKNRESPALEDFKKEHSKEIEFEIWLQWRLYQQFKSLREYAKNKNILLIGDLPILVSRDSSDVWAHPEFFKLELAAGAPPDMYCAKGQRWGMPTYNWEKIAIDDYRYLKEKLRYVENFFDILRIDHVVGLFRIWSIPYNEPQKNKGLNGFFDPQDESIWFEHGRNLLSLILNNTDILICAEDLGIVPKVCTDTLKELAILGNDVQRWVKDWDIRGDFIAPEDYRAISVAMLSTHDTTNWAAWWENEAGTVDEELFKRKCNAQGLDYTSIKNRLFDLTLSRHGRLRWLNNVDSVEKLIEGLIPEKGAVPKAELTDFINLYKNTYQEKENFWRQFNLEGRMREKCDSKIIEQALKITLESSCVFCINTIIDWLYLSDIFKGDPYQYRINTPGTVSEKNWSLTIPIFLEGLLKHKVNAKIRKMIESSGRI